MTQKNNSEIQGCERERFSVPENQLVALLLARCSESHAGITALDKRGDACALSYAELYAQAAQLCAGLQSGGLRPGDRLVLQLSDALDVMVGFWGCILAGVVPVSLNTAQFYDRPNSQTDRLISVVDRFCCRAVLASPELFEPISALLGTLDTVSCTVLNISDCRTATAAPEVHTPAPDDPAAMFLTSGSTGAAKGVVQSHAAMLAMADATIQMNGFTADDVTLNWMSLDHAGSMVFLGVMPMALGASQVHVPIDYVLKEPTRWLDLIETWRASITWAPNFVFSLLLDREQQLSARSWDLSCMRFMVNAGEAVVSATARRFLTLLQKFGLPEDALRPAFGMVETCSGITWSTGFRLQDTTDGDSFVSLGSVIPGAIMKIVDESGVTVKEGLEGKLLLKGASVFNGYDGEDALNATMLIDGWLVTGDLAYIKAGKLHVTGREKDMVIINGNNHYCHEIEAIVGKFASIASDCVAAVGVCCLGENSESLVIFYYATIAGADSNDKNDLEKALRAEVARLTGIAPRAFVALPPEEFPRTEIGKIKRSVLKRRYENAEFDQVVAARVKPVLHDDADADDSGPFKELLAGIIAIWQRALRLESVGLDESFFELGGSSLLAIQVQHELELLLGREVSMVELFDTPTIRTMASHFSGRRALADKADAEQISHAAHSAMGNASSARSGDIAVIGIACRFPGAHGPDAFWRVLEEGVETLTFFTPAEAIAAGVPFERAHDPAQVNVAPVLDDVEGCDLDFWKYARREAQLLDPQQRVFLETAWEAFEDAGYVPGSALGKVGVYASAATNTYLQNNVYANSAWVEENGGSLLTVNSVPGFNVMVANDKDYLPTRVSYKLDLTGPSMGIQTACSSTLVAVHEAARALREGECNMAIAGGCALMLPQHAGHYYEEGMINSPDGHCRAYDSEAKGTIFGSGSGAVLLKRLEQAQADGDAIYAVIKGSAVVNDGGQKMGFTAPSMLGEYRAIAKAIENAGVDADSIGFVEGHGTGTPIGDPIEVQALTKAFRHSTQRNGYCALGSVKTNIGHMGIASGIAGFIKAVLALHHKTLPATLHFREANPAIGFDSTPFFVSNRTRAWEAGARPRRAGVNSLGIGGTNVHVILEEAPAHVQVDIEPGVHVLPISAGTDAALRDKLSALADFVARHPDTALADIAFTHQRGRLAMACRRAIVVSDRDELLSQLARLSQFPEPSQHSGTGSASARIVFMFTGQGSQYAGMGRALYETHQVYREALDDCTKLFAPYREHSIRDLILAAADDADAEALLNQTQYTQPALFCIQVALVQLYRQLGIRPDCIVGHSIGEVAGVWTAGGLSLADAVVLVEARSRLMQAVTQSGAMASVKADVDTVSKLLRDAGTDCEIAGCNSPFDTTITGDTDALTRACDYLQQQDIRVTVLNVSHAFHSRHMEAVQREFAKVIANLEFRKTHIPVICNLDVTALEHDKRGADYWIAQLRAPVQFMQGLQQAQATGSGCFVEIGPAAILCGLGRALDSFDGAQPPDKTPPLHWIPTLRKGQHDVRVFANALATLFTLGHAIDWSGSAAFDGRRAHLPTYPWQRQRCWIDPDRIQATSLQVDPLRVRPLVLPRLGQQLYTLDYSPATIPVLDQHRVFGVIVPPAALYVSQLLHTAADFAGHPRVVLNDVNFVVPMHLGDGDENRTVQILYGTGRAATRIELSSQSADLRLSGASAGMEANNSAVQIHVAAELLPGAADTVAVVDIEVIRRRCSEPLKPQLIEAHMAAMQVQLGESFLCFQSIHRGHNEALALLNVPGTPTARIAQGLPSGLIDCHWQTMLAALSELPAATIVPARIDTLVSHTDTLPDQVWAHALIHQQSPTMIIATVSLLSAAGRVLLESRGIEFRVVAANSFRHTSALRNPGSLPTLFSRHWETVKDENLSAVEPPAAVDRVWLAGNVADAKRLAAQLRSAGVEPLLVTEPADAVNPGSRLPLIYIDCVTGGDSAHAGDSGAASCMALNRFLAALEPGSSAISQVLVVTALPESSSAELPTALSVANRSALAVQTVAAAHELQDWTIRAVEMDQQQSSIQALLGLSRIVADSGRRLRITAGVVQTMKADLLVPGAAEISFASDRLQVITGGLGGLGLLTAQWMFRRGARHFLLVGRSAPSKDAEAVLASLREQGALTEIYHCDVSQYDQVVALAAKAGQVAPVETVIHAAGARRDGLIGTLQDDDFSALAQAKAVAAVNLHEAFRALKPRYSIYYSSIAAWLGGAGQSNYCAANAALDSLARQYSGAGCHTISVAWGPWHQTGMTATLSESQLARISSTGYGFVAADTGFALLGRYLVTPFTSDIAIMAADTDRLATLPGAAGFFPASTRGQLKSDAAVAATVPLTAEHPGLPVLAGELLALNQKAAEELMQDHLARLVADMTSPGNKEHIDFDAGFLDMGIDSLAALELRKKIESALDLKLKSTLILDYPNIAVMARELVLQLQASQPLQDTQDTEVQTQSINKKAKPDRSELLRQLANEIDLQE